MKYENGNLYNKDGTVYAGKVDRFTRKTVEALGQISKSTEGNAMITELQTSKNQFIISKGAEASHHATNKNKAFANQIATDPNLKTAFSEYTKKGVDFTGGSGAEILWDPSGSSLPTTAEMKNDPFVLLAHELFHGLDANRGMLDERKKMELKGRSIKLYIEKYIKKRFKNSITDTISNAI